MDVLGRMWPTALEFDTHGLDGPFSFFGPDPTGPVSSRERSGIRVGLTRMNQCTTV